MFSFPDDTYWRIELYMFRAKEFRDFDSNALASSFADHRFSTIDRASDLVE
jgi:hypothetical protein